MDVFWKNVRDGGLVSQTEKPIRHGTDQQLNTFENHQFVITPSGVQKSIPSGMKLEDLLRTSVEYTQGRSDGTITISLVKTPKLELKISLQDKETNLKQKVEESGR